MDIRTVSVSAESQQPKNQSAPDGAGLRISIIAWAIASFGTALIVGVIMLISMARGQGLPAQESYSFELFDGPRDSSTMERKAVFGPFADIAICYTAGAIAIDAISEKHPDRNFMGRCDGGVLLVPREIAERAMELLSRKENKLRMN